jgi:hypothetical protein
MALMVCRETLSSMTSVAQRYRSSSASLAPRKNSHQSEIRPAGRPPRVLLLWLLILIFLPPHALSLSVNVNVCGRLLSEYISIAAVTAAYGFALTASPFCKRQKGTKRLCPTTRCLARARHALSPALLRGSPRWAIHGPARLNRRPAGLPTAQCLRSAIVVNGAPKSKAKARRPDSRPEFGCT